MKTSLLAFLALLLCLPIIGYSQKDTVQVSIKNFIERGIKNSGELDYEHQKVKLADNRIDQAKSNRYLPRFELNTQHGVVPGVKSNDPNLSENEYYLDPNLENDWENWAVFTRAEVKAIQPLFSWGALKNTVKAAQSAAVAAREQFNKKESDLRLKLFELYQSYLLTSEILYLLEEAEKKIEKIDKQIKDKEKQEDSEIDESDVFKFEVYKEEFKIRAAEVREEAAMTQRIWNYVLQADENTVYIPDTYFLDPVPRGLKEIGYYRSNALSERAEVEAIDAGIEAAKFGVKALKQKNYPSLFLGLTGSFANTPNRPRQSNPFIINNSNYASASFGIGIRQNLDFFSMKTDLEKGKIKQRQAKFLKDAAVDGIVLEINQAYKNASLSKMKVERTDNAFVTSKKWLRQEQLDYDMDMGDTKDLVDAMKKELELRVKLKREIFEFNKNMAALYRKSGLPIMEIINNK
ncbi:TolC family protein [Fodinibius halophilus]|uniref:TolC family protein n=1 Tax=Fodinibius halophilus TaxID=1736908 RepID=A0A6M1T4H8_9BACT|nr:TolC family protein [Fodinibius halophilus]NGP86871.1 TolC family protein [Fodinibius halophilus]